jgi:hypothetical protein
MIRINSLKFIINFEQWDKLKTHNIITGSVICLPISTLCRRHFEWRMDNVKLFQDFQAINTYAAKVE